MRGIEDEGLHPAGDDPDWQESAYLAWRDPVAGLGGNHRIGNEPNRSLANLWCGVYRVDGTRFRHNDDAVPMIRLEDSGLCAGPQRLYHDGKTLRFLLEGDGCTLDFEVVDDDETFTESGAKAFTGVSGAASGTIFSNNFHVHCRVRGTATLDGITTDIDGAAWRDHSWGVRRWDSFLASRSFAGAHFGGPHGTLRFRYGSMVGANGSFMRHGGLTRDGEELAVAAAEMIVRLDDDSIRCDGAQVRYSLVDGATVTVEITTIGGMVGATRQRFGWESVGDVTVDGAPGGWGFLEVNNNPRNGTDPPAFVLSSALTNGVVRA